MTLWYGLTSVALGVLLFFPVKKIILALSVNRHIDKVKREITPEETAALTRKATIIAAVIAVFFAFFYNKVLVLKFFTGGA